jgi:hypothetical protein
MWSDVYGDALTKLRRTLEAGGVIFLEENGDGPAVRHAETSK